MDLHTYMHTGGYTIKLQPFGIRTCSWIRCYRADADADADARKTDVQEASGLIIASATILTYS